MSGITLLNILFHKIFYFINNEIQKNYTFITKHLKNLYKKLDLSDSELVLTDNEKAFINAFLIEFPYTSNLLCI